MFELRITEKKEQIKYTIIVSILFALLTHGYRFFNSIYTHDSLLMIVQNDNAWQISLGRFLQPFIILFRGNITSGWLIGFLAVIWWTLAVLTIVLYFDLNNKVVIALISAIMVSNLTVINSNAAFLPWVDIFGLALFTSLIGIILVSEDNIAKNGIGILFLIISLGLYQAYIEVAITIAIIILICELAKGEKIKCIAIKTAKMLVCGVVAGGLYFLTWKGIQKYLGIWTSDGNNGFSHAQDFGGKGFFDFAKEAYSYFFSILFNDVRFSTFSQGNKILDVIGKACLLLTIAFIIYSIVLNSIKNKPPIINIILQFILLALLPFGANCVYILDKGIHHTLINYSFYLVYVFALILLEQNHKVIANEIKKSRRVVSAIIAVAIFFVVWSNIVFANQIYQRIQLTEKATVSLFTRIVSDIEDEEGYVPGETPVVFLGNFEDSPYLVNIQGFEQLNLYGMGKTLATYNSLEKAVLNFYINANMNIQDVGQYTDEMKKIPNYPAKGSIQFIEDRLVVKISDWNF